MDSSVKEEEFRQPAVDAIRVGSGEPPVPLGAVAAEDAARMLHELQVHQIELEMQNEELLRSRQALEDSQARYFELYNLAPVAYVTVNEKGLILEINRAAEALLGVAPDSLIMAPFAGFVAPDSQDALHLHRNNLLADGEPQSCELRMLRTDGSAFWARMESSSKADADGGFICRVVLSDISNQKRSFDALAESADFTTRLIQSMQDGLSVIDANGVAMDANPAMCEMTGFSREELVGTGPPHPYWPPEEYPRIQAALEETMTGPTTGFELVFMRKNGERFPVMVSAFAVMDRNGETIGYAATVKDITVQKQSESALRDWNQRLEQRVAKRTMELRKTETRFRQLAEATFEGIAIIENGVVIDGNTQLAGIFGVNLNEILGSSIMDLIAPESRSLVMENINRGLETRYEFVGLLKDGGRIPLEAHARIIDWLGKATRVTAVRDLTAQKQAQAQLLDQQAILNESLRLALVSEISAGIIHQIGQPLTAIALHVTNAGHQLSACESKTCEYPKVLGNVQSEVSRMVDIAAHLRALGDPEKPRRLPVDFNETISEQILLFRHSAQDRGISLQVAMDDSIPQVSGDAVQLAQVVNNLIRNAVDACEAVPEDRRSIEITTRKLPDENVELCVSDSGMGIAPDVLRLLFTPFFTTKTDGLGIGLRLSRTIVEAHGGSIKAFSNPDGIGATFRVVLPVDPAEDYTKA